MREIHMYGGQNCMRNFLVIVVCLALVACYAPVKTNVPVGDCPSCKSEPVPVVKATPPPPPPPAPVPVVEKKIEVKPIYFDFDKAVVKPIYEKDLNQVAGIMKQDKKKKVYLTGRCDTRGSDAYNLKLGQKRADAVEKELVKRGVEKERISLVSKGKAEATKKDFAKDRRVDIIIK